MSPRDGAGRRRGRTISPRLLLGGKGKRERRVGAERRRTLRKRTPHKCHRRTYYETLGLMRRLRGKTRRGTLSFALLGAAPLHAGLPPKRRSQSYTSPRCQGLKRKIPAALKPVRFGPIRVALDDVERVRMARLGRRVCVAACAQRKEARKEGEGLSACMPCAFRRWARGKASVASLTSDGRTRRGRGRAFRLGPQWPCMG